MLVENKIVPGDAGIGGEPIVNGEFFIEFSGYNLRTSYQLTEIEFLVYYHAGLFFCRNNPYNGPYSVYCGDKWFKLEASTLKKLKVNDPVVVAEQTFYTENFEVRELDYGKYQFINREENKEYSFGNSDCQFLLEEDGCLYFLVGSYPSSINV